MRLFAVFITIAVALCAILFTVETASAADWRWKTPKMTVKKSKPRCDTYQCTRQARHITKLKLRLKKARFKARRQAEWTKWTRMYIPQCTWYGESGTGPEYSRARYTMPNSTGSGAYGKFQFMSGTYHNRAKYHDWSPLDQEIAARREFWANGTAPWTNC